LKSQGGYYPWHKTVFILIFQGGAIMSKVAVVTDSTAYLPKDLVDQYQIPVAPLVVIWGEETLRDDIDITPTAFYERLKTAKVMPSTSQPPVPEFENIFRQLHEDGYEILAILISALLSGTIASAEQAKLNIPEATIEIFDSQSTAMALGFQVLAATRAAEAGASLSECVAVAEKARQNSGVVFAVDTLEFLHRGGRIGGGARYLGTALQLKPLLTIEEGKIEALDRVRTKKKAHERLSDIVVERVGGKPNIRLATLNANAVEDANALLENTSKRLNVVEKIFSEVSPVIGTHVGPGTVGLAYVHD
jgi:DegV family protein with EDD domain